MSFTFDGEGFKPWYLGDGIYGFWAPWGRLTLSVKPGENSTTAIHLEPAVVERLEEAIAARHARCLKTAVTVIAPKTSSEAATSEHHHHVLASEAKKVRSE